MWKKSLGKMKDPVIMEKHETSFHNQIFVIFKF